MTDRPILFSAPMVRALIDGSKGQTRRNLYRKVKINQEKAVPKSLAFDRRYPPPVSNQFGECFTLSQARKISVGDRLWVRETCRAIELESGLDVVEYLADKAQVSIDNTAEAAEQWLAMNHYGKKGRGQNVPGIHQPRWASRLTLTVTDVRVERLQQISKADAIAEGIEPDEGYWRDYACPTTQCCVDPRDSYRTLWNSINGAGAWGEDPWVVAITFTTEQRNIDA